MFLGKSGDADGEYGRDVEVRRGDKERGFEFEWDWENGPKASGEVE